MEAPRGTHQAACPLLMQRLLTSPAPMQPFIRWHALHQWTLLFQGVGPRAAAGRTALSSQPAVPLPPGTHTALSAASCCTPSPSIQGPSWNCRGSEHSSMQRQCALHMSQGVPNTLPPLQAPSWDRKGLPPPPGRGFWTTSCCQRSHAFAARPESTTAAAQRLPFF